MSITDQEASHLFSHFPVEDSLGWDELCAIINLPAEPRSYFLSDQHVTREVFGSHEDYRAAQAVPQHLGEVLLKAS